MSTKHIILWSSYSCQLCTNLKNYFQEQDISYENKDMKANPALRDELESKYQVRKAPVIEINDKVIIGAGQFTDTNWEELKALLN